MATLKQPQAVGAAPRPQRKGSVLAGWLSYSPGIGPDLWIMGLVLSGLGTILGAVNFITTIFCLRAPGMTMFRMPIFTWNTLLTSMLVLMAFPVLAAAPQLLPDPAHPLRAPGVRPPLPARADRRGVSWDRPGPPGTG